MLTAVNLFWKAFGWILTYIPPNFVSLLWKLNNKNVEISISELGGTFRKLPGFELVKQNWFTKVFQRSKEKGLLQAKNFLDLKIILWKMQRVLTKFCKLIWLSLINETLSVFLCLIKLQARIFRSTQNLM